MLTLEEKGLSGYGNKFLQFSKNDHKSEEVLKWNPRGQLPTLVVDNAFAINESHAGCEFIEKLHAKEGTPLTPDSPAELAKMLQRKSEWQNMDTKGYEVVAYKVFKAGWVDGKEDPEKSKKLLEGFFEELKRWDGYAAESEYIAGSKITLADLIAFPNIALYVRMGLNLEKHAPNIFKYYNRMIKRPSVEKTWPPHWKESPATLNIFG